MKLRGLFLIILGVVAGRLTTDIKVHAQQGCSASSLNGTYGYKMDGSYFDNVGNAYQYSAVGRMVADGNGGLTGVETNSNYGMPTRNVTYTGTYTVNDNCTGSIVLKLTNAPTNYDFVILPSVNQMNLIETESGITITGVATAQLPAATPTPSLR